MEILQFEDLGDTECHSAANAVALVLRGYRISIATYNVPQGGIYAHIKFERDLSNIFRVRAFTSSGLTGGGRGGDAKTRISPNTSFVDIIRSNWGGSWFKHCSESLFSPLGHN